MSVAAMLEILQQCRRLLPEMEHLTKMNDNNKFKMVVVTILNVVHHL